jgi:hypothetical protein
MQAVRDQADRISRCRMTFQIKQGNRTALINQNILDTAMLVDDDSRQGQLFIETAKLSEMFSEQLKKHPVPVDEHAIKGYLLNPSERRIPRSEQREWPDTHCFPVVMRCQRRIERRRIDRHPSWSGSRQ